jgi:membrane associated rhomboid family serine protease
MIPIGDSTRSRSFPYVNVALIIINFVVFFYELYLSGQSSPPLGTDLDRFVEHWGNIPGCTFDALGWDRNLMVDVARECREQPSPALTPISAMFMHLGWLHILGNMLFLWIFGDNVEDAMGHVLYAVFYFVVGIAAALAHGLTDANSLTPALGASGAVAGVMGAYIVLHPRSMVTVLIPPLIFFPLFVPAIVVIGVWFIIELISGFASLGPDVAKVGGGVAYFAHIGGFIAGALLVSLFAAHRKRARRPSRTVYPARRDGCW